MKTYKIYYMLILTISILSTQNLYSQKVYKNGDGQIILDLGPDSGFPQVGAVTTTQGAKVITPNASSLGANNDHNGSINATLYYKLEIAPSDYSAGSDWVTAYNGCKGATINGTTGWRLPTQRELMLIWVFKAAIEDLGGSTFGVSNYWSATEYNTTYSWGVNFSLGTTDLGTKDTNRAVRCTREL